jgi:ribosomal protein S18 acetylase RimI-like enzyme
MLSLDDMANAEYLYNIRGGKHMNIRLAIRDDVKAISDLYTEFFAYNAEQQPEYYVAARESGEYPTSVIDSNNGDIFVVEIENMIVGFVHVEEDVTPPYPSVLSHKFACIVDFIVNKQYRKNGIGKLLLEEVKHWAKSRELQYIELMVLENNDIGKSFYERELFSTVSRTMRLDV